MLRARRQQEGDGIGGVGVRSSGRKPYAEGAGSRSWADKKQNANDGRKDVKASPLPPILHFFSSLLARVL